MFHFLTVLTNQKTGRKDRREGGREGGRKGEREREQQGADRDGRSKTKDSN